MNALSNPTNYQQLWDLAKLMYLSGFFEANPDPETGISQLATRILAGQELGYAPFTSVQNIRVFRGKPELSANLMAAAVKRHPVYNYSVDDIQDDSVTLLFYKDQEILGSSRFSHEDALQAGLMTKDTYQKYPRNLFFARAMSNGVRWFVPDVFLGAAVYVEGEISGEKVNHPDIPGLAPETPAPRPAPATTDNITLETVDEVDSNASTTQAAEPAVDVALWQKPASDELDEDRAALVNLIADNGRGTYGDDWHTELPLIAKQSLGKAVAALDELTIDELRTLRIHMIVLASDHPELLALVHEHGVHLFAERWTDVMLSFASDFFNFEVDNLDDLSGHELGLLYKHLQGLEEPPTITEPQPVQADPHAALRQTIHLHAAEAFGDAVISQLDNIITNLFGMSNLNLKDLDETQLTTLHDRLIVPDSTPESLQGELFEKLVQAFGETWGASLTRICQTMFNIQVTALNQLNHAQLQILACSFVDITPDTGRETPDTADDPHAVDAAMSITAINNEIKLIGEGLFAELWPQKRREQINRLTGERTAALSKLSREEAAKLLRGLRILAQRHAQAVQQETVPA